MRVKLAGMGLGLINTISVHDMLIIQLAHQFFKNNADLIKAGVQYCRFDTPFI